MEGSYLRTLANRCLTAACECFDLRAKAHLQAVAEDLVHKANEIEGLIPAVAIRRAPANSKPDRD